MASLVITLIQTLSNAENMHGKKMVGVGSSLLPYHALVMVNGGRGSNRLPYHVLFMVNGGRGSSHLPYHAPFMVNRGHGSIISLLHPLLC